MCPSNGRSVTVGTVHNMRMYRTITFATCGKWRVRVVKKSPDFDLGTIPVIVNALAKLDNEYCRPSEIASALDKIQGIVSFEIIDVMGNGGIVYNMGPDASTP